MVLMKIYPRDKPQSRVALWGVRTLLLGFIGLFVWVTLRLVSEGNNYSATGSSIITALMMFFLLTTFIKLKEYYPPDRAGQKRSGTPSRKDGEYQLLCSSGDVVRIALVEEALRAEGIECIVLDRHGTGMMSFIPGIQMRVIVPQADFERSVRILEKLPGE